MKACEPLSASRIKCAAANSTQLGRVLWLSDDFGVRGTGRLLLRISPRGGMRFYFRWTVHGTRRTVPLGPYSRIRRDGYLTIAQARDAARAEWAPIRASGTAEAKPDIDVSFAPSRSSLGLVRESTPARSFTVMDLCNAYVAHLRTKQKYSVRETNNSFLRHIKPSDVASTQAHQATPNQFAMILREIVKAGHGNSAQKLRSHLHAAYSYALKSKTNPAVTAFPGDLEIEHNPIASIDSLAEFKQASNRFLDESELAAFWRALQKPDEAMLKLSHRFIRLSLLLGGQRCLQLLRLQVKDVDFANGSVLLLDPKGNRKTPRQHLLPIGPLARRELEWLLGYAKDVNSPLVFAGQGTSGRLQDSTISTEVRSISQALLRASLVKGSFMYADLRRTVETTLASLGVPKDIRAQIQSHGLSGIQTRHYDRYEYMKEKREALLLWEQFLASLLKSDLPPRESDREMLFVGQGTGEN